MTQKIQVDLNVNEAKAVSAWLRYRKSIEAVNQEMGKTGRVSRKNKQEAQGYLSTVKKMGAEALTSFTGIGSVIGGIAAAAALINQQHEALIQRQKNRFVTGKEFGEVMRDVRVAFTPDKTVQDKGLEQKILKVAKNTRTNENLVGSALIDTFSAKGAKSNQDALNAVEAAFSLTPNNLESGKTLAARALDLANAYDSNNMKANVGFMQNIQESARVTSLEKVGANLLPGIISVSQQGDTPEQAAEITVALNKLMTDAEGRLTRTAVTNMSARLAEFVPDKKGKDNRGKFKVPQEQIDAFENAKNTTERIAVMQQSPELSRQFFSQYSFDAASAASVKSLLTGTDVAKAQYSAAQQQIKPLDDNQVKTFEDKVQRIEGGAFQPLVRAEEQSKSNVASSRLDDKQSQLKGAARKIYEDTLGEVSNFPGGAAWLNDLKSGTLDNILGRNDIESYIESLKNYQNDPKLSKQEKDLVASQRFELEKLNRQYKELTNPQQKAGSQVQEQKQQSSNPSFNPVADLRPAVNPASTDQLTRALQENTAALREQKEKKPAESQKPIQVKVSVSADTSTTPNGPRASASLARPAK